ncbi:hypothetical protein AX774_g1386 [Zancudomyces culisetae]|uniref:Uncharacterized protein n=1 Tax=Zancudomyces culisetae TaxID=1213189 RepID=A0A1R1PVS1_ZANCU|nr:hypothetical protein AX774_g1386 [Zancudomyces culisetae]|eukprot:OMH85060.1 hypothetical protein AX774_g1386 [Zancudomyces culisetae]
MRRVARAGNGAGGEKPNPFKRVKRTRNSKYSRIHQLLNELDSSANLIRKKVMKADKNHVESAIKSIEDFDLKAYESVYEHVLIKEVNNKRLKLQPYDKDIGVQTEIYKRIVFEAFPHLNESGKRSGSNIYTVRIGVVEHPVCSTFQGAKST